MKPTLYLEKDLFSEDELQDTTAIISQYFNIREIDLLGILDTRINPKNILYGRHSLNIAKILKRDFKYFDAIYWMSALRNFTLSPRNTYFNDMDFFVNHYSDYDFPLFLRPTNGFKSFSGQVFPSKEKLREEWNFIQKNKNIDTTLMCMTSPVKKIDTEWRTIFIENQYCSGSQYLKNDEVIISCEIPQEVIDFSKRISVQPYFQNIQNFCIDVCKCNGNLHLLEINSFDCSSFYGADLDKIYKTWSTYYES